MRSTKLILVFSLVVAVLAFVFANDAAALSLVVGVALLPCLARGLCELGVRGTKITFDLPSACSAGKPLGLGIDVRRPKLLRGRLEFVFVAHNVLTNTTVEQTVMLEPSWGVDERFVIDLDTRSCGRIEVEVASVRCFDFLGLGAAPVPVPVGSLGFSYLVYPAFSDLEIILSKEGRLARSGTAYDYRRKGSDHTEVFDLREYQEGDSQKSVHWKISARMGELMVREPSRPSDFDIALVCGLHRCDSFEEDQALRTRAAFSVLSSASLSLLRRGISHVAAFRREGCLETRVIDGTEALDELLELSMTAPLPERSLSVALAGDFLEEYGITKAIVVTDRLDGVLEELASRVSLSVVCVGIQDKAPHDVNAAYSLTYLPYGAIGTKVKNLEL